MTKRKFHFYLLRGLTREAAHWGELPAILAERFPGSKVTCLDLPGSGENRHVRAPLTIDGNVAFLRERYLCPRERDERPVVLSISLGGMIAGAWLARHPEDFESAVLINSSFKGVSPLHHRLKPRALLSVLEVLVKKGAAKEREILRLVSNEAPLKEERVEAWTRIARDRPVTLAAGLCQLFAAATCRIQDEPPRVPVLILASRGDRMVDVECSRRLSRKWNSVLVEHATAGHDISVDDPSWIVDQIGVFLQ